MTPFSISGILIAASSASLGSFVLWRGANRRVSRIWFAFSLSAAGWGVGSAWLGATRDTDIGLMVCRLSYAFGVLWIAPTFFHFVTVFLGKSRPRLTSLNYAIAFLFFCTLPTHYFFKEARLLFNEFAYGLAGVLFPFFFAWWMGLVIFSHFDLARSLKKVSPKQHNQILYFFIATAIGFTGGSLCYLANFGLNVYPWGNFSVPFYPIIMAYAILRFDLMDVRLFVRRVFVLSTVYLLLIGLAFPLLAQLQKTGQPVSRFESATEIVAMGFLLSLGPLIYAYLLRHSYWLRGHTTAGLTHELKSPLVAIQSAADVLLAETESESTDKHRATQYLRMIQQNATRLDGVVRDLLNIAKTESGPMELVKVPVQLADIVDSVMQQHRYLAESKGLSLTADVGPHLQLVGDPDKLRQILSNLISNAVKFSERGTIRLQATKCSAEVKVSVLDDGRGVPKKYLSKIFTRFFQVNQGTKGTGLGLAIAKAWVEAHGGRIWAESEGEGKGTMVTFTLPAP